MKNLVNVSTGIVATGHPLALRGYDATTFFTHDQPQLGTAEFAIVHDGATYYCATQANADDFKTDPARFVPSFGGFCAYGVSVGKKFDGDPLFFTIADQRLYLNLNASIQKAFLADVAGAVAKADQTWPAISEKAPADL